MADHPCAHAGRESRCRYSTTTGASWPAASVALVGATEEEIRCSFCEKTADEVDHMVAMSTKPREIAANRYAVSTKVAACDQCVALCVEVLDEAKQSPSST